jgi:hypothetical protein
MASYAPFYQEIVRKIALQNETEGQTTHIVEAGVRYGCSARIIEEVMKDLEDWHLDLIDPFPRPSATILAQQNQHITFHPCAAEEVAPLFEDGSIDLLHIDVDTDNTHPYKLTRDVFDAFLPKLRPSAQIIFHDATDAFPGVLSVIGELIATGEWKVTHCAPVHIGPYAPIAAPAHVTRII